MRRALLGGLLWLLAVPALADAPSSVFWRRLREPASARAEALLRQGRALLLPVLRTTPLLGPQAAAHRHVAIEAALSRLERARALREDEPEVWFLSGKALTAWERTLHGKLLQRNHEAIDCFLTLRRLDPWYEAEAVAFELGVLYTREARFADAASEYRKALQLQLDEGTGGATLGNLAEVTMLAGELESAVALYERAVLDSSGSGRLLALWGLSVALDRLGEHGEALLTAQRAVRDDQAPLYVLEQGSVFFVPAHERHYYEGLGHLALAHLHAAELRGGVQQALPTITLEPAALANDALAALQRASGEALGHGHDTLIGPLHGLLLDELARRAHVRDQRRAPLVSEQNARLLGALLDALTSFSRYVEAAGEGDPWAVEAQAHRTRLRAQLAAVQLRSNAKQHALDRLTERAR